MKTIIAKTPQDSFSFSRIYFHWKKKGAQDEDNEMEDILNFSKDREKELKIFPMQQSARKKISVVSISKLRTALALGRARTPFSSGPEARVVATLFGQRRGHVQFVFQEDFKVAPAFRVELATPTNALVKEGENREKRERKREKRGGDEMAVDIRV